MTRLLPWVMMIALVAGCSGDEGDRCQEDSQCPSGRYCNLQTGECTYDCTFDSDCPGDLQCTGRGKCGCEKSNGGNERCDNVDNDCDGDTDEDLTGEPCSAENELGRCTGVERCREGTYLCDAPEPAPEDCDLLDNDCDGDTDEGLDSVLCPLDLGVCAGVRRTCQGAAGWSECDYGPDHQEVEQACDLLDNDCDGETDEELDQDVCQHENEFGLCQGHWQCVDGELACDALVPAEEICDQIDNDCDGVTDENAPPTLNCEVGVQAIDFLDNNCDGLTDEPGGCMVRVTFAEVDVYIDVFENTVFQNANCSGARYGITHDYPGTWPPWNDSHAIDLYACSVPDVQPSAYLTWYRAQRACQAQGKRLCTKAEWSVACGGESLQTLTYGDVWQADICNDFSLGTQAVTAAGSQSGCLSPFGTYDMSGNLWEFVSDACSWEPSMVAIQGGSYGCTYCDPQNNCVPCDPANPAHLAEIESRYACHYPGSNNWCELTDAPSKYFGFRCCLDP